MADCLQNGSGPYKPKHMRFKQTEVEKGKLFYSYQQKTKKEIRGLILLTDVNSLAIW